MNCLLPLRDSGLNSSTENLSTARRLVPSNLQTGSEHSISAAWPESLQLLSRCARNLSPGLFGVRRFRKRRARHVLAQSQGERFRLKSILRSLQLATKNFAARLSGARETLAMFSSCFN